MVRKSQGESLVFYRASLQLKKRLRLEALRRGTTPSELGLRLLDESLPLYEEFIDNETERENGTRQTIGEQLGVGQ